MTCAYCVLQLLLLKFVLFYWLSGKESACNARATEDVGSVLGLGRSLGGGHGTHSSIFAWRIPIDREAWWATILVANNHT